MQANEQHSALPLDTLHAPAWQRMVEPIARLATPEEARQAGDRASQTESDGLAPETVEAHRLRFIQAGLRQRSAPVVFYATKVALAVGLPLLVWSGLWALDQVPQGLAGAASLLLAAGIGLHAPQMWLERRTAWRQRELFEAFPDATDLMIVCVEAGLGLDAALERTERDMALRSPVLADELSLLGSELRLGTARAEALKHLAQRTGVEEIRLFVAMLVQAERFGIGVADALRVHAKDMRLRRQLRAEEEAAKMPVKMLFPLIFTLFPSLMVVLMGPATILLMRQLKLVAQGN